LRDDLSADDLGLSAYKGSNLETINGIIKAAETGRIPVGSVMIIEALDRLTRLSLDDAYQLFRSVLKAGIEIYTDRADRHITAADLNNPMSLMMTVVELDAAYQYSDKLSYRIKASWIAKNKRALERQHIKLRLPSWIISKDGKYIVDKAKAKVIHRIFKMYNEGYGAYSIAKIFNKEAVPNIARKQTNSTNRWRQTYIYFILNAKEVIGYYCGVKPEVSDFYPAIIAEADYYEAKAKAKERNTYKGQRNNAPHIFSHLLKCGSCGDGIGIHHTPKVNYLCCSNRRYGACRTPYLLQRPVQFALMAVIANANPEAEHHKDDQTKIKELEAKLKAVESKLATASAMFNETPSNTLAKNIQAFEASRDAFSYELNTLVETKYIVDHRNDWRDVKAMLEADLKSKGLFPYTVIPVSLKMVNNEMVTIRHTEQEPITDIIALRESLRQYIDRININIPKMQADILFKNGKQVSVLFKKSNSYPRRYFYKTGKMDWTEIDREPNR